MSDAERLVLAGADGLELVASAWGARDAAPVLLLHGGGQTRHAWEGTGEALANAGFRSIAVDQRGHGESGWPEDGDYALAAYARDVRALVAGFRSRPIAVGASLGGLASLLAEGEREGPLLAALVLVDVAPRLDPVGVSRVITFMSESARGGFSSLEEAADAVARYLPNRKRPTDTSGLAKNLRLMDDGRWRWHWDPRFVEGDRRTNASQMTDRLRECAERLAIPTLLVRGASSDVLTEDGAREFLDLVPRAEYADVGGAAHMVAGDRNDAFTRAVVEFLVRADWAT